jgi:hypothetical protein
VSVIGRSDEVAGGTPGKPRALDRLAQWGPVPSVVALVAGATAWAVLYAVDVRGFWLAVTLIAIGPGALLVFSLALRPPDQLARRWRSTE